MSLPIKHKNVSIGDSASVSVQNCTTIGNSQWVMIGV